MRRFLIPVLAIFFLSGCKPWVSLWAATPTFFPTPSTALPPTPEPTATFNPLLCLYVEDFRPLNELTTTYFELLDDAGFSDFEVQVEAYGQVCLDDNKEVRVFLPRQTNIRLSISISSLEELELVGNKLRDILDVICSIPQDELPGSDIGNLSVTFSSAGNAMVFSFPLDLGRRALEQGLSGDRLVEVLQ